MTRYVNRDHDFASYKLRCFDTHTHQHIKYQLQQPKKKQSC